MADFGAAISGANKLLCQRVLEELDVYKRLKLTLELVKKEMDISKIQESIAKAIEEKISGEQRRYLLNEQLKTIKRNSVWRQRLNAKLEFLDVMLQRVKEEERLRLASGLTTLAEFTECDIRACFNTLQFLNKKKEFLNVVDISSQVVGRKDMTSSIFDIWRAVLQKRKSKVKGRALNNRKRPRQ